MSIGCFYKVDGSWVVKFLSLVVQMSFSFERYLPVSATGNFHGTLQSAMLSVQYGMVCYEMFHVRMQTVGELFMLVD